MHGPARLGAVALNGTLPKTTSLYPARLTLMQAENRRSFHDGQPRPNPRSWPGAHVAALETTGNRRKARCGNPMRVQYLNQHALKLRRQPSTRAVV